MVDLFMQGDFMINEEPEGFFANSVLNVKASGLDNSVENDLKLPDGKSIASLIYDQQKTEKENQQ